MFTALQGVMLRQYSIPAVISEKTPVPGLDKLSGPKVLHLNLSTAT